MRGGSRNNGDAGGRNGTGSAAGPRVSSPCLTHPHGGSGGGGPQLLLPTLAGREAATAATAAATLERRRAPHRACASRPLLRALAGPAPAQSRGGRERGKRAGGEPGRRAEGLAPERGGRLRAASR